MAATAWWRSLMIGGLVTSGSAAWAEEGGPRTAGRFQVQAEAQYGAAFNDGGDPYKLGFGAEAGFTLPMGLYVGAAFDYFLGDSESLLGIEATVSAWTLMAEVGYDVALGGAAVLRPELGVGVHTPTAELCTGGDCDSMSETHAAIAPGLQLVYLLDPVFISAELRGNIDLQATDGSGVTFGVGVGAAF